MNKLFIILCAAFCAMNAMVVLIYYFPSEMVFNHPPMFNILAFALNAAVLVML